MADKPLVLDGTIALSRLFTIRRGEVVYDNVADRLICTDAELIKIKTQPGRSACVFLSAAGADCHIYSRRPLECRRLRCWDTRAVANIYRRQRLTRRHLVADVAGLWELICEHDARCDYFHIQRLFEKNGGTAMESDEIQEIIAYDYHLRRLVIQKGGLASSADAFLFGRPLHVTLPPIRRALQMSSGKFPATHVDKFIGTPI